MHGVKRFYKALDHTCDDRTINSNRRIVDTKLHQQTQEYEKRMLIAPIEQFIFSSFFEANATKIQYICSDRNNQSTVVD